MHLHFLPFHLLLTCTQWKPLTPFPTGAPNEACDSLHPNETAHGGSGRVDSAPYRIDLSALPRLDSHGNLYYTPSTPYTRTFVVQKHISYSFHCSFAVTALSNDNRPFKGFLVQGRLLADETTPVGIFSVINRELSLSLCDPPEVSSKQTLTHSSFHNAHIRT